MHSSSLYPTQPEYFISTDTSMSDEDNLSNGAIPASLDSEDDIISLASSPSPVPPAALISPKNIDRNNILNREIKTSDVFQNIVQGIEQYENACLIFGTEKCKHLNTELSQFIRLAKERYVNSPPRIRELEAAVYVVECIRNPYRRQSDDLLSKIEGLLQKFQSNENVIRLKLIALYHKVKDKSALKKNEPEMKEEVPYEREDVSMRQENVSVTAKTIFSPPRPTVKISDIRPAIQRLHYVMTDYFQNPNTEVSPDGIQYLASKYNLISVPNNFPLSPGQKATIEVYKSWIKSLEDPENITPRKNLGG